MDYFRAISLLAILLTVTSCTLVNGTEPPQYAGSRVETKKPEAKGDEVLAKAYELHHQLYKPTTPTVHGKNMAINSLQNNLPSIQQYAPAFGGNSGQAYPRANNYDLSKLENLGVDNLGQGYERWNLGNGQIAGDRRNLMVLDPNTGYMYSFDNASNLQFVQNVNNQARFDQSRIVAINEVPSHLRRYLTRVK